jgi:hypothetical protein
MKPETSYLPKLTDPTNPDEPCYAKGLLEGFLLGIGLMVIVALPLTYFGSLSVLRAIADVAAEYCQNPQKPTTR